MNALVIYSPASYQIVITMPASLLTVEVERFRQSGSLLISEVNLELSGGSFRRPLDPTLTAKLTAADFGA